MDIRPLKPAEWISLVDIFDKVFESDLPSPNHAEILGCFEDNKLKGFVLLEQVQFVGLIYVKDEKKDAKAVRKMLKYVREKVSRKQAVAAVASEPRFEMLFKTLGMQKIPGTIFRRNEK